MTLPKKSLKTYVAALLKIAGDSVPKVRKNVFSALGAAWKVVGEQNVMVFLADVDHLKMEKIKESMEKTILLDAKGNPRTGGDGRGAAPAATAKAAPTTAVSKPTSAPPRGGAVATGKPGGAAAKKPAAGLSQLERVSGWHGISNGQD